MAELVCCVCKVPLQPGSIMRSITVFAVETNGKMPPLSHKFLACTFHGRQEIESAVHRSLDEAVGKANVVETHHLGPAAPPPEN